MNMALFLILGVVLGVGLFYFFGKKKEAGDGMGQMFGMLQNQMNELSRMVDHKLGESTKINQRQFGESSKLIREITHELTKVGEGQKRVTSITDQLQKLQDVLQNPKQRGVLGEYFLEAVLQNVLPPTSFKMQYPFSDGKIVDAVVFLKDKFVPIDSKFSLENFNRMIETNNNDERERLRKVFENDLKLRIKETAKYIRPSEGTTEFAFMFIPSEGIYYDLLTSTVGSSGSSLIQRASAEYKVIIVSPTSFLAYLQTVWEGLKGLKIEEKAREIIKNVVRLSGHIERYEEYYKKLGNSLSTTLNHYDAGYKELGKVDKDILRITDEAPGIQPVLINRPKIDE